MQNRLELKIAILRANLRQRQIAIYLQIPESYLSDLLNGIKPCTEEMAARIHAGIMELTSNQPNQRQRPNRRTK